jgi:hypothetical protein
VNDRPPDVIVEEILERITGEKNRLTGKAN